MKSAAVFLAEGFEEIEAVTPIDILRRANVNVVSFSTSLPLTVTGSHNISFAADDSIDNFVPNDFDIIILPGGQPGTQNLLNDSRVINAVISFHSNQKLIAAICAAPSILLNAGVLGDTPVTSHHSIQHLFGCFVDTPVVHAKHFITSQSAITAPAWAFAILHALGVDYSPVKHALRFND